MTVAIVVSDIHLSAKCPVARAPEPSWVEAQGRYLDQLRALAEEHDCPVLIAGDIFDRWNTPPEIINLALARLPKAISIPGQHDLPNHNLEQIERSAYWTLVEAGVLNDISGYGERPGGVISLRQRCVHVRGYAWGNEPQRGDFERAEGDHTAIAIVHAYCWRPGKSYPGADEEGRASRWQPRLAGFDAAAFGDNHKGFTLKGASGMPSLINCGAMIPRSSDERGWQPQAGLIQKDGSIKLHKFDTSDDKWADPADVPASAYQDSRQVGQFIAELKSLNQDDELDFRRHVARYCEQNKLGADVKAAVLATLED